MDYLELDLSGTWLFNPRRGLSSRDAQRADITIRTLGLNTRDYLLGAREAAYNDYLAHLEAYVEAKRRVSHDLSSRAERIEQRGHPTVWREMKRQRASYVNLSELFAAAPELTGEPEPAPPRGCLPAPVRRLLRG